MFEHASPSDVYVPYGRGGAGNMRRRSDIVSAWSKLTAQKSTSSRLTLISSPDDHYGASKSIDRRASSTRASSTHSTSTAGEHKSGWRKLLKRKSSMEEEEERKIEESE